MSNEAPAPAAAAAPAPVASPAMVKAWETVQKREGELHAARDQFYLTSKSASVKEGWTKKQLTVALLTLPKMDPARVSECVNWVFPKVPENRAALDAVMEHNSQQKDHKARIGKDVQLAIQRSQVPITVEEAKAAVAAKQAERASGTAQRAARTPESGTPAPRALTPQEQSEAVQTAIIAAAKLAKGYGFDSADFQGEIEIALEKFNPFGENPNKPAEEDEPKH